MIKFNTKENFMARYSKAKKMARKYPILFLILVLIAAIAAGGTYLYNDFYLNGSTTTTRPANDVLPNGNIEIHFIDVGQGDGALIKTPEGNIIIDSGPKSQSDSFIKYLQDEGVTSIKYAIFTHPHEDHMGSAQFVLDAFEIENVIMNDRVSTSDYFEKALDVIEKKEINTICAKVGDVYSVGGFRMTVVAPNSDKYSESDTNNSSIIIFAEYGENSFVFTGDAEKASEAEVAQKYGTGGLDCDLLKVGHHGSSSSSTEAFLTCISPEYAVISVGEGNSYGHPTQEVLSRLEAHNINYYTTAQEGSIVFVSDGTALTKK